MAIAHDTKIIDIYKLADDDIYKLTSNRSGAFTYLASWNPNDQKDRGDWKPNKEWRGCEGGGNLFVSEDNIYFIAFQREEDLSGADWACLYRLNFVPGQKSKSFTITK